MRLDEIVKWYQKKVGTYDKQHWENTVEQKILSGFTGITLKTTKLKTEFIDVDLVRGSTFPKAKPKQSLITVIRLAILRYLFLPVFSRWWIAQTSPKFFVIILSLYITQVINFGIYCYHVQQVSSEEIISISEIFIPMALSLTISLIHSQIVATSSCNGTRSKRNKFCKNGKYRETIKKRKKLVRPRNSEQDITNPKYMCRKMNAKENILKKVNNNLPDLRTNNTVKSNQLTESLTEKLENEPGITNCKKRNVNWDFPIHNYALENDYTACSQFEPSQVAAKTDQVNNKKPVTKLIHAVVSTYDPIKSKENTLGTLTNKKNKTYHGTGEDDGFESLNGKSSSGEENQLVNCESIEPEAGSLNQNLTHNSKEEQVEFESNKDESEQLLRKRRILSFSAKSDLIKRNLSVTFDTDNKTADLNQNILPAKSVESSDIDEEDNISSPPSVSNVYTECTTSATEWLGITTNSDECSYSSELGNSDYQRDLSDNDSDFDHDYTTTVILNPCGGSDRISCTIWDCHEIKKAEMSVLDISACIIEKVEAMPETCDYIYIGCTFSILLCVIPTFYRLCEVTIDSTEINYFDIPHLLWQKASFSFLRILRFAFGESILERTILVIGFFQRLFLTFLLFFLLTVAERTFKQRFLYAKLFSHLTSSRRARKSSLPHFRLNKVRNIKTWLSVRSYLKRRGPQRSIDVIVSAAFISTLLLLSFLSVEWLKDSGQLHTQLNLEALLWSSAVGIFLLRFMTLGNKINRKYRSISVLITEQINLYLQIEQKPQKKEELMVSNSVLKLAADLLKELESPFKISGLSANPYLYTTIKVVIMSALSGVLSEMLGFKLKLHKIKIK